MLTDDEIRRGLRAQGVPDRLIEAQIHPAPRSTDDADLDDARLEKEIVAHADKQLRALGFVVVNLSQARPSKITAGISDREYFHPGRGLFLKWEAKTASGIQSPAQRQYQEWCDACRIPYVVGTDEVLFDWLCARGVAARVEGGLLVALPYNQQQEAS